MPRLGIAVAVLAAISIATPAAASARTASFQTVTIPQALLPGGTIGPATLRWNPCGPLRYAINTAGAPAGFAKEAQRAVSAMAKATGLAWTSAGRTLIRPNVSNPSGVPGKMHSENLQLVISWNTLADQPHTATPGEGAATMRVQAGTVTTDVNGVRTVSPTQITEAAIVIDRSQETILMNNDRYGNGLYRLLLHQLGHAVGLDHVTDAHQIMNPLPRRNGPVSYGPGDLAGLRVVGREAGCL